MEADARAVRDGRPVIALSRSDPFAVAALKHWVLRQLAQHRSGELVPADPGPMAPHSHADGTVHAHAHTHGHEHAH
jgi:urease accessory protein